MKGKLISKSSIPVMALLAVLAAVAVRSATIPTVAVADVSGGDVRGDYRPSAWARASELSDSGKAPSLTTDVELLEDGAGSQLWLGYGLVGAGLLALAFGLAVGVGKPRGGTGSVRRSRHQLGQAASPGENARASLPGR